MSQKLTPEEAERKIKALEEENARLKGRLDNYQQLLKNLNEVIYTVDSDGKITYISPNIKRIAGYKPEELIGRRFTDFVHPDEFYAVVESFRKILEGKEFSSEYQYLTRDRGYVWGYTRHKPVFRDGRVVGAQGVMVDIQEKKKTEERFALAIQASSEGIWEWDLETGDVYCSQAYTEMLGCEENCGVRPFDFWLDLVHPEDRDLVLKLSRDCIENRCDDFEARFRMQARNGEWLWILGRGKVVSRDDQGYAARMVGMHADITECKKAEDELRNSEQRYRLLMENICDIIFTVNEKGDFIYITPNCEAILGCQPEEFTGKNFEQFVHPDDAAKISRELSEIFDEYRRFGFSGVNHKTVDYRALSKEGKWRWLSAKSTILRENNGNYEMVGVARDITEKKAAEDRLKESEERYRFLVEESNDILWTFDLSSMTYTYCSKSVERILGYSREETIGLTLDDIFLPDIKKHVISAFNEALKRGGDTERVLLEAEHCHKEGGQVCMEISAVLHRDRLGQPISFSGVSRDVSSRKKAEKEKQRLNEQLRQAQKMEALGRMAGAVAHHFNNQLSVVIGYIELTLEDFKMESEAQENLTRALSSCRHSSHISNQLLSYIGQSREKGENIDLSELCFKYLPDLETIVPENVCIEPDFRVPGPAVHADENELKQVLTGLVLNSCEAIEEASGRVELRTRAADSSEIMEYDIYPADWKPSEDYYACLEVSDTGCGISKEHIDKIFDPFFSTKFTGRGLGLAVALGIVRASGGAIGVYSRAGQGSVFRVFLPLEKKEEHIREPEESIKCRKAGGDCTVLLVEDRPEVRRIAKDIIRHSGYKAIAAADGYEAVNIIRQGKEKMDCVITDFSMPGMDGWDTLNAIKKISPDIPVILASGWDEKHATAGRKGLSPEAFIQKPFRAAEIRSALEKILK